MARPAPSPGRLRRAVTTVFRWHRPLIALAAASLVLLVVCIVGVVTDPRVLTGLPIWDKPAKFAVSVAVYSFTLAWLISLMPRRRRLGSILGTISAAMLAGELVAIVAQVVRGRTSHFDFATPLDAIVYQSMAGMIATLWLCNLALVVLLLIQRLPDRSLMWALRLGLIIAVIGMGLAYLMTLPTPAQQASWGQGGAVSVVGAHTVGLPDGGPGLPLLGWSTVGGDLRIPHFVGLHGLQVMILLALGLIALGRRTALLSSATVRLRLVVTAAAAYLAVIAVLAWQALRGQSVIHPDALTAGATAAISLAALAAAGVILRAGARAVRADVPAAVPGGDRP